MERQRCQIPWCSKVASGEYDGRYLCRSHITREERARAALAGQRRHVEMFHARQRVYAQLGLPPPDITEPVNWFIMEQALKDMKEQR